MRYVKDPMAGRDLLRPSTDIHSLSIFLYIGVVRAAICFGAYADGYLQWVSTDLVSTSV